MGSRWAAPHLDVDRLRAELHELVGDRAALAVAHLARHLHRALARVEVVEGHVPVAAHARMHGAVSASTLSADCSENVESTAV